MTLSTNAQKGLWYGVSAGVQNTMLSSKKRSEIDSKNAFRPLTTLDIEYRFSPKFAIQSGLGYALYTQNTSKFQNNFNYLLIPVYFKWGKIKAEKNLGTAFYFGYNFKHLFSAFNIYNEEKNDISGYAMKNHTDITAGYGIKYKINKNILFESYVTGAYGGIFNNASFDYFVLTNINYGIMFSLKYKLIKK